jgi:hypothetical protein
MASTAASTTSCVGFLTVVHYAQHGYFGGLLAVNPWGRPREFHCTMPVLPSRAQEILYGATLRPYLCGEQIATALLAKLSTPPVAVLTDDVDVLSATQLTDIPVLLVPGNKNDSENDSNNGNKNDSSNDSENDSKNAAFEWLTIANWRLASAAPTTDAEALARLLADFTQHVDPAEPFERIRAAIDQAQRSAA